jgi:hypothetical protein
MRKQNMHAELLTEKPLGILRKRWKDKIKINFREMGCEDAR